MIGIRDVNTTLLFLVLLSCACGCGGGENVKCTGSGGPYYFCHESKIYYCAEDSKEGDKARFMEDCAGDELVCVEADDPWGGPPSVFCTSSSCNDPCYNEKSSYCSQDRHYLYQCQKVSDTCNQLVKVDCSAEGKQCFSTDPPSCG